MPKEMGGPGKPGTATPEHEKICPYSHARRNNVDVQLTVAGR